MTVQVTVSFKMTLDIEADNPADALATAFEAVHNNGYAPSGPAIQNPFGMDGVTGWEVETHGNVEGMEVLP